MWFSELKNKILDVIFPVNCLNCGKMSLSRQSLKGGGKWLCEDCVSFVEFRPVLLCPRCGHNSYLGRVCKRCKNKSYLDGLIAMDKYSNLLMKNLIKSLKFRYITDLAPVLNKLVRKFCLKYSEIFPSDAILIPVPLHPLRLHQREFNQAEFIAEFVSSALSYKISKNLKRVRYTYRQSELPKEMKEDNIKGAFEYIHHPEPRPFCEKGRAKNLAPLCHPERQRRVSRLPEGRAANLVRGSNEVPEIIILVDDVYTSGATMQECAKVLKEAGAKEVWGFVLARG